jgi:hypothetical protein
MDRASAALGDAAAIFDAGDAKLVAQHPQSGMSGSTSTSWIFPFYGSFMPLPPSLTMVISRCNRRLFRRGAGGVHLSHRSGSMILFDKSTKIVKLFIMTDRHQKDSRRGDRGVLALWLRKATMGDIAEQAGISRQTLYARYANKDEIMAAAMQRIAERVTACRPWHEPCGTGGFLLCERLGLQVHRT